MEGLVERIFAALGPCLTCGLVHLDHHDGPGPRLGVVFVAGGAGLHLSSIVVSHGVWRARKVASGELVCCQVHDSTGVKGVR